MLGPPKSRHRDEPVTVSLEDLVPRDNFYRHLEAKLDLGCVREWARECYAERGRPSSDPVVCFRLQRIMFFEGIRSERKLIETASLNLVHRWYLGDALDEEVPDHSSLTRIRQRLGVEVCARFFARVVDRCQETGLIWGKELFGDATKVEAHADFDALVPRFDHEAKTHLADLCAEATPEAPAEAAPAAPADDLPAGVLRLPRDPGAPRPATAGEPPWRLLEERRRDPHRPSDRGYDRMSEWLVSPTDPDATPMRTGARTTLGYHDHCVVDGGKARIILAALVTPADVMENVPLRDLLWRVCFRRKLRPPQVTAEARYGTIENIVAVEDAGIRAYVPLIDVGSRRPGYCGQAALTYDADRDEYRGPQGHALRRYAVKSGEAVVGDRGDPATCNACPLQAACTESDRGRMVHRSFYTEYLERVRGDHETAAYQKAMRKRQVWVEPLFAEGTAWHGLRRFRLRGLVNITSEGLLIAAGQNLKRFLAATGWGRRHAPCGSLLALPKPPLGVPAACG
jgi:transposase